MVVTAFGASGLLEAGALTGRSDLAARATEAARLGSRGTGSSQWILRVPPGRPVNIHNANLLGAWLVHVAGPAGAAAHVQRSIDRTLDAQRPDGSWPYGEAHNLAWTDRSTPATCSSASTACAAWTPVSARRCSAAPPTTGVLRRGGTGAAVAHKPFPEDAHSAGTGLSTLGALVRRGLLERELLERVARRVLEHGLRSGRAVHRRYRWGPATVRYLRWCDAHVALGLVDAAGALRGAADLAARAAATQPA